MGHSFQSMKPGSVKLLPGIFLERSRVNRKYMMSLENENLLQNYYFEAGLWSVPHKPSDCHWGWESPTCQLRGHFLGHWLSGAARMYAWAHDEEIKAKADYIVSELGRCQKENGGEWAGSIPEKYFDWIARGKRVWAPHYTVHKTLMGLFDMFELAGNEQALYILVNWAKWFHRWTGRFSRDELDDILDVETGGMLEVWANLYGVTKQQEHLDLIERYDRPRLFNRLLAGEDVLTNMHANTTIPEVHGAARAWEVTGESRWREIVEAYWQLAVEDRGFYCTGSQTCGEIWTPPGEFSARLGDKNQEHCVPYNMMRLAQYLFRWTGDMEYADYWERNLYNGILAQQHPETGMVAYFLPLEPGAVKKWGSPTEDFWCCHGTLVQAHTIYYDNIYFAGEEGLMINQYIPNQLRWTHGDINVEITLTADLQEKRTRRPDGIALNLTINAEQPVEFALDIRLPWWLKQAPTVTVNGDIEQVPHQPSTYYRLHRRWTQDQIHLELPKGLTAVPLSDAPDTVAFMDGPVVLAALCNDERTLYGDPGNPQTILTPHNEREWIWWRQGYRTINQERGLKFLPLYEVRNEHYTVYFPVRKP